MKRLRSVPDEPKPLGQWFYNVCLFAFDGV